MSVALASCAALDTMMLSPGIVKSADMTDVNQTDVSLCREVLPPYASVCELTPLRVELTDSLEALTHSALRVSSLTLKRDFWQSKHAMYAEARISHLQVSLHSLHSATQRKITRHAGMPATSLR